MWPKLQNNVVDGVKVQTDPRNNTFPYTLRTTSGLNARQGIRYGKQT